MDMIQTAPAHVHGDDTYETLCTGACPDPEHTRRPFWPRPGEMDGAGRRVVEDIYLDPAGNPVQVMAYRGFCYPSGVSAPPPEILYPEDQSTN